MTLSDRFTVGLAYAANAHAGQLRKGTSIPYLSHLLAVTAIVLEHGGDEESAIAALLHDAVEDAGGKSRLADIRTRFGDSVALIVEGCTDADTTPKPPWRKRKESYLARLGDEPAAVQLVSAADKLHNARSLLADHMVVGSDLWSRFSGGKVGTLWYYRALVNAYSRAPARLLEELDRVVTALEQRAATKREHAATRLYLACFPCLSSTPCAQCAESSRMAFLIGQAQYHRSTGRSGEAFESHRSPR
jgi:GTP pyrophosphokinase